MDPPKKKARQEWKKISSNQSFHVVSLASLESPKKKTALFVCGIYIPKNPLKALGPKLPFFLASSGWWIGIFQEWSCHHRKWRLIHKGATWKFHHCDPHPWDLWVKWQENSSLFWDFYSKMTGKLVPWCEFGPLFSSLTLDFLEFSGDSPVECTPIPTWAPYKLLGPQESLDLHC